MTISTLPKYTTVFDLACAAPNLSSAAFHRLFELSLGHPHCKASPQLAAKYGVALDNSQAVLRVSNKVTLAQCWYNKDRTKKPQTFAAEADEAAAFDPLARSGGTCDFCDWQQLTAEDMWGRVEGRHTISASNLFKYVKPAQGVVLFKHHDPLHFSLEQLQDLVAVSHAWLQRAAVHQAEQDAALGLPNRYLHPLFVWNCLPRGGASQFHGHSQVLLSDAPFPTLQQEAESVACYAVTHGTSSRGYYHDELAAHEDVGLLLREGQDGDFAFAFASLAPWKDMEVCVHGSSMDSPAFQRLFYTALRALIDELGVCTFNASIHNIKLGAGSSGASSRSSSGGTAVANRFMQQLWSVPPVVARVVSRGRLSNLASDFGGLEVFGSASIGHTDPFHVADALRKVQAGLPAAS